MTIVQRRILITAFVWLLAAVAGCYYASAEPLKGTVDLDNRFVSVKRDGKPVELSNKTMWVEVEPDLSGSFSITTVIEYKNKKYTNAGMCDWEDEGTKTNARCSIECDGGNYEVIADWGDNPGFTHGPVVPSFGMAFNKLFIKIDKNGFRVAMEEDTESGVGPEFNLSSTKDELTLPVTLEKEVKKKKPEQIAFGDC